MLTLTAPGGLSSAAPARGGMLCRCSASRIVVDTRASYPSGQSGLPQRPASGVSGSTVLDHVAPQPLGAGVQMTRVAAVPVSAPRPVVRPYKPSLWGAWPPAVALLGRCASKVCPAVKRARPRRYNQVQRRSAGWEAGHGRLCAGAALLTCSARATCIWSVASVRCAWLYAFSIHIRRLW